MKTGTAVGRKPARRAGSGASRGATRPSGKVLTGVYLEESEQPGTSLIVLLPLVILYELYSAGLIAADSGAVRSTSHITAFLLVDGLFQLMGVVGRHLPAFALVTMLLGAHVLRKDRWRMHPGTPFAMAVESIAWAAPLLILGWVMARYLPLAGGAGSGRWAVLCVGAGLYEEMVFRLIVVTVLLLVLRDLMGMPPKGVYPVVLLSSGVLFAFYHYLSPGEDFRLKTCVFRTAAGVYFGALFLLRGFGVTALCHTSYDLIVVGVLSPM